MVVKDGNVDGGDGVRNRVDWKERSMMECGGKAWNVRKVREWCRSDVGASGMDLEKFYVTDSRKPAQSLNNTKVSNNYVHPT